MKKVALVGVFFLVSVLFFNVLVYAVDTTVPKVNYIATNERASSAIVIFSVSDDVGIKNCSVHLSSNISNFTESSVVINNSKTNRINLTNLLPTTRYRGEIFCSDSSDNMGKSKFFVFVTRAKNVQTSTNNSINIAPKTVEKNNFAKFLIGLGIGILVVIVLISIWLLIRFLSKSKK